MDVWDRDADLLALARTVSRAVFGPTAKASQGSGSQQVLTDTCLGEVLVEQDEHETLAVIVVYRQRPGASPDGWRARWELVLEEPAPIPHLHVR